MVRVEHTIVVDRPPTAEVFVYIAEPANVPEWQASALESRKHED
jgi:hypothetical protein